MILKKIFRVSLAFVFASVFGSCVGADFQPNPALDLDGYGPYPSEVGPIRFMGPYLTAGSCNAYTVSGTEAYVMRRELTGLFSGHLPFSNLEFTLTTRLQFLESCASEESGCYGNSKKTREQCCPDGYLSLVKSWSGKTNESGDFTLEMQLSPQKWDFLNTDGTSALKEMGDLYFMFDGRLSLIQFEYEIEFKSLGLGSQCVDVCKQIDFYRNEDFKSECEKKCALGELTLHSATVDLMNSKIPCPERTDYFRFGKFENQSPKIISVKSADGKSAKLLSTSPGNSGDAGS